MLAVALEDRVLAHVNLDVQIARRSAVAPRLALAGEADAIAGIDARGNLDRQLAAAAHAALPEAGVARILDDGARAAAAGTGLLQLEETLRNAHLPGAAAGIAGGRRAALGRARAVAGLALGELRHFDLHRVAEDGLGELELDLIAQVGAAEHLRAAAAARRSEDVAEHIAENVAEGIAGAEAPRPPPRAAASTPAWPY